MKIAIVSHMFPTPQDSVGGIFVLRQARALSERGHDVEVISPVPYVPEVIAKMLGRPSSAEIPRTDSYADINVHYPRHWSLPRPETIPLVAYLYRRTLRHHRQLLKSADLVNAHTALPDGFGAIPLAEELDIPIITTIHGADIYKSAENWISHKQIQTVFDRSDRVIMNSHQLLSSAKNKFEGLNNAQVVYNGIPTEEIESAVVEDLSDTFPEDRLIVTTIGTLIPRKRHKVVLDAIKKIPSKDRPYYLIIGAGPLREELEVYASDLDLDKYIYFTGYVPDHNSVFAKAKFADIMAMPSSDEAFGIAYLEAMACGLPVIACEGEGPADFISHRETGFLVPPKDPDAIADIIQEIQADPQLREHVADRGQRTALNGFSWERNAKAVERIFNEAIKTRK